MKTQHQDVLAVVQTMTEAFHEGDIEAVMASYEPLAAVAFERGTAMSDDASLRQMFDAAFQMQPRFVYAGHEVIVCGDLALHIAPWRMRGTAPGGAEVHQEGLSVAVLRRQSDGRWLLVIDNPHGQQMPGVH